jgi:hypothetical protein
MTEILHQATSTPSQPSPCKRGSERDARPPMSNANIGNLSCRHCRYYRLEGKRGGQCQMLGVPVRGLWPACGLAVAPFAPSWEVPQESRKSQSQRLHLHRQHLVQGMPPPPLSQNTSTKF